MNRLSGVNLHTVKPAPVLARRRVAAPVALVTVLRPKVPVTKSTVGYASLRQMEWALAMGMVASEGLLSPIG